MSENLPSDPNKTPVPAIDALTALGKPANWMILIGAPKWVRRVIVRLHTLLQQIKCQ